tara:strand:+ start:32222 stop:33589 length:1368 start_codon:yes stop_codon:yes gene_type:complete
MKQNLTLTTKHTLKLTPQLQQALKVLQQSNQSLQTDIQELLDTNPLLEQEQPEASAAEEDAAVDDLPLDVEWQAIYPNHASSHSELPAWEEMTASETSLQDHLRWQLEMANLTDIDRVIGLSIIDAINEEGFLTQNLTELHAQFEEEELDVDEFKTVLHTIQLFDPTGVGAADIKECMLIQLQQFATDTPGLTTAKKIITKHLSLLGQQQNDALQKACAITPSQLQEAKQLIHTLQPRPCSGFSQQRIEYVVPELVVYKKQQNWKVELNEDALPKLRINQAYHNLIAGMRASEKTYMNDNLQQAKWFLQNIQQRQQTILKVATEIMQQQRNFLEYGGTGMKPLILRDIAERLEIHESTVSRATTQKYILTPYGIYELKHFFSSHVKADDGQNIAATAIQAEIKSLIDKENPSKPLSDSKIVQLLAEREIDVARRTVSKYREALKIAPSHERKILV